VPGSTWPNRLSALTGEARSTDNTFPPIYARRSFVRSLPESVSWRWYSSDPGSLRLVDDTYRIGYQDHFGYVEKPSLVQPRTFYTDAMKEELPNVAWIDPNFVDLGGLQGANDDHPPTDVMAGQSFVIKIYQTLKDSALWEKSMLVIVYDEHGGFYDHVDPTAALPTDFAARAEFRHFGPRVPAIIVSPFVQAGAAFGSAQHNDARFLFDHTALIKTILLRFAGGNYAGLPDRIASSSHLGHLLTGGTPRSAPEVPQASVEQVSDWWAKHIAFRLMHPSATIPALQELGVDERPGGPQAGAQDLWALLGRAWDWIRARFKRPPEPGARPAAHVTPAPAVLTEASELQLGVAAAARQIRRQGLPPGQP
jgi:phospholipase C